MRSMKTVFALAFAILAISLTKGVSTSSAQDGQKLAKSIHIQAQAMGQQQQLGQTFGINLIIEEFSTPDDQKALMEAFQQKGNEGLVNALSKMKTKGHMAITGTLGYDVAYARQFKLPDGSTELFSEKIRRCGPVLDPPRPDRLRLFQGLRRQLNAVPLHPACHPRR